ncbi:amidohydrolase [Actinosynnema sp. NPDC050801]|uniref:amidohydrolase n=1 Tax=unclassified Actinosynnema TaxID=2637065 RepID=UPI003401425F
MRADVVFVNGTVWSGHGFADSVAVRAGEVVAVGGVHDAGTAVDLEGGFLMPAFGDGHAHPVFGGLEAYGPRVGAARSVQDVVQAVREYAVARPDVEWIVGGGYDPTLVPDGRFDARWLDRAVADRPVVLRASDYHTVWCNSEAMRRAGLGPDTPEPAIGRVHRHDDGRPLGTLVEWQACDLVLDLVPPRAPSTVVSAVREAGRRFAAAGVTWVQDAWVDPGDGLVEAYAEVASGGPAVRVSLAFRADPAHWRDQAAVFAAEREKVDGDLVRASTVKFFADGVVEAGTAALLAPYEDDRHDHGMQVWRPDALAEAVAFFDAAGFQAHVHAIGDAGVRAALDAVEHTARVNGPRDRRPVVAHVQLVDPADLGRFAELGVIANFEPLWAQLDAAQEVLTLPRLGPGRGLAQYPMGSVLRSGARISFGSDWPVTSLVPFEGVRTAVTRQTPDGRPSGGWVPAERLDVADALRAYTQGSAYQAFAETRRGTLAVGNDADLVWLDRNPFTVPPADLAGVRVLGTWLAGRRTW